MNFLIRSIISIGCGIAIGKERKKHDKSGGSRTMAIICFSANLIAILTQQIALLNPVTHNFTRLMAYTIAGISFIGNGVIMKNEGNVEGLTTASSLLACVIIGFCIGLGFYIYGIISAILVFLILESKYIKIRRISKE